jgi:hypothetical protein
MPEKEKKQKVTSKSSKSMSGCNRVREDDIRPALLTWSLKNRSFLDISAHRFTCPNQNAVNIISVTRNKKKKTIITIMTSEDKP